jgi:hypothetical protein
MGKHEAAGGQQEKELSPAARIFENHGLGHLLEMQVVNPHTQQTETVSEALACGPFGDVIGDMDTSMPPEVFNTAVEAYIGGMAPSTEGAV